MTTAYSESSDTLIAPAGVYAPQEDSQFLIDVMEKSDLALGRRVADLCTGSGVVGIAAGEQGRRRSWRSMSARVPFGTRG